MASKMIYCYEHLRLLDFPPQKKMVHGLLIWTFVNKISTAAWVAAHNAHVVEGYVCIITILCNVLILVLEYYILVSFFFLLYPYWHQINKVVSILACRTRQFLGFITLCAGSKYTWEDHLTEMEKIGLYIGWEYSTTRFPFLRFHGE